MHHSCCTANWQVWYLEISAAFTFTNLFFGKIVGFQYLIVQNGKFIDAALQYLAIVKLTFLNFYTTLPYCTHQMTTHIQNYRRETTTRKYHLRGQNSPHAYYSKSSCQVVKSLITELSNPTFMLILNSS